MTHRTNDYGQPVGSDIPHWQPPSEPDAECLAGRFCRLEPLDAARHAEALWQAWQVPAPEIDNDTVAAQVAKLGQKGGRRHALRVDGDHA